MDEIHAWLIFLIIMQWAKNSQENIKSQKKYNNLAMNETTYKKIENFKG